VNQHQRTSKGFGPALGPEAAIRLEALLRNESFEVRRERSDWRLGADQPELQRQLIAGWAAAATEMATPEARRIRAWEVRRLDQVDNARSEIVVGHDDVGAILP